MQRIKHILTIILIIGLFVSFLCPEIAAYFINSIYIYTNGWDEPTYLSYQGALGIRSSPSYFVLYLVSFLHELGISGAVQNLIFDIAVPISIFLTTTRIFISKSKCLTNALFFAAVIVFGPVLLIPSSTYANLINSWSNGFFLVSPQQRLPLLRTPNPQFSYLFITLALYFYMKFKNRLFLLVPIPVLYLFVMVPYSMCIFPLLFIRDIKTASMKKIFCYSCIGSILVSSVISIAFHLLANRLAVDTSLYKMTHIPVTSVS